MCGKCLARMTAKREAAAHPKLVYPIDPADPFGFGQAVRDQIKLENLHFIKGVVAAVDEWTDVPTSEAVYDRMVKKYGDFIANVKYVATVYMELLSEMNLPKPNSFNGEVEDPSGPQVCVLTIDSEKAVENFLKQCSEEHAKLVQQMHAENPGERFDTSAIYGKSAEQFKKDWDAGLVFLQGDERLSHAFPGLSYGRDKPTSLGGELLFNRSHTRTPEQNEGHLQMQAQEFAQPAYHHLNDFAEVHEYATYKTTIPSKMTVLLNELQMDSQPKVVAAIYAGVKMGQALQEAGAASIRLDLKFDSINAVLGKPIQYASFTLCEGEKQLINLVYTRSSEQNPVEEQEQVQKTKPAVKRAARSRQAVRK